MPRYFFNVYHERSDADEVGEELPDQQAAWKEATITAGHLLQSLGGRLNPAAIGGWRSRMSLPNRCS